MAAALGVAPSVGATPGGDAPGTDVTAANLVEAKRLFEEAERAAEGNDSARALELMQKSYELSGYPWLLFNLGILYSERGDCQRALASFEKYLEAVENGKYRPQAATHLTELRPRCGGKPAPPVPPPLAQPAAAIGIGAAPASSSAQSEAPVAASLRPAKAIPAEQPTSKWSAGPTIGVTLIGTGAVAAGFAVFYGVSWADSASELDAAIDGAHEAPVQQRPSWSAEARALTDERDAHRTRTIVFSAVSASLIGAGLGLVLWAEPKRERRAVGLQLAPGQVFLEYTGATF